MSFIPKRSKYSKYHKGKANNRVFKRTELTRLVSGTVGLKALTFGRITSKQFTAARQAIAKIIKKSGRVTLQGFPDLAVSKKPIEVRMGKGKGSVDHWAFKIRPGYIFCEVNTESTNLAVKALTAAKFRLPIKTKIVFN